MTKREVLFAVVLAGSGAAIVYGVSLIHIPAAWILGGLTAALIAWLVLSE